MIFRSLDSSSDWRFGAGKSSYAKDNNAIVLNIETSLKTFATEWFLNPDIGVPWFDLINEKNKDYVVLKIKSYISELYGVIGINELSYSFDSQRKLEITYNIDTIYQSNMLGTINI